MLGRGQELWKPVTKWVLDFYTFHAQDDNVFCFHSLIFLTQENNSLDMVEMILSLVRIYSVEIPIYLSVSE